MDPMFVLDRIASLFPGKRLLALANLAAERAHDAIWLRVIRSAITMNEHEAQGYIRARAAAVIQRESARILYDEPALSGARENLISKATEIAVASVWSQIASLQRQSQTRRRAA